jgi:hypothetical protein
MCSESFAVLDVASEEDGEFPVKLCGAFGVSDVASEAYGELHRYAQASFGVLDVASESINQSIIQAINHSINQSVNQINQFNHSAKLGAKPLPRWPRSWASLSSSVLANCVWVADAMCRHHHA